MGGQPVVPVLMAGLPAPSARVCVGPPLLASGCRRGSPVVIAAPHVVPGNWRLVPPLTIVPPQFSPEPALATIVFVSVIVPELFITFPPELVWSVLSPPKRKS